jgi:fumarate reductase subunit C
MATPATQAKLWYWQRVSAMLLAVCVVIHLVMIIYASRGGLTAGEILARTRGSAPFAVFYSVFVIACAVHVPIGLKSIAVEWLRWRERTASIAAVIIALAFLAMGLRAVYAVYAVVA